MTGDPTANIDAERALLGALLVGPRAITRLGSLTPEDFADGRHGTVYAAIQAVVDADALTADHYKVIEHLTRTGDVMRVGGGPALFDLIQACPSPTNAAWYAKGVRDAAQARKVRQLGIRLQQVTEQADLTVLLDNAAALLLDLQVVVDDPGDREPVKGLSSLEEFVGERDEGHDWVIPGLLERQDRVIVVASEGAGKTTLSRQVAVMAASGLHPFVPDQTIPPVRTLIIDLENPPSLVRRKVRHLVDRSRDMGLWTDGRAFRWTKPGGLDIRRAADVQLLDRVLSETRPALVSLGPLYKSYLAGTAQAEQAAAEAAAVLDRMRERHGIALWLEAHAPLAQHGVRDMRPMASGLWSRWPEFGLALRASDEDPHVLQVGSFRGHRDERQWPTHLHRGSSGDWPWRAVFDAESPAGTGRPVSSDPYYQRQAQHGRRAA